MTDMTTFTITMAALAAAISVPALAQGGPPPDPYGDATVTQADVEKNAADRFAQLDANHDGTLSVDEQPNGGRRFGGGEPGPLTKDAFVAAQVQRFQRQDADHDGNLTKAERDAFRAQMMQRFQQGGGGAPGGQ
ncbi:MAG TPA: EF-hand domain-containing protein [Croceibacterium sp.]|nr:EF-hand domain-containing protein [Croceibacterium sp.]